MTGRKSRIAADERATLSFAGKRDDGDHDRAASNRRRPAPHAQGRAEVRARGRADSHEPGGAKHGGVCIELGSLLNAFVKERHLGRVMDSSTGFRLPGGNIRVPDLSFVAESRLMDGGLPEGFFEGPPDLAVEVLSPSDRADQVLDRIGEYLDAGVRLVWLIDPGARSAAAYRSLTGVRHVDAQGFLDGEDVVPGFRCRLADVLD
jgi:Uma2 family endonuclease